MVTCISVLDVLCGGVECAVVCELGSVVVCGVFLLVMNRSPLHTSSPGPLDPLRVCVRVCLCVLVLACVWCVQWYVSVSLCAQGVCGVLTC